MIVIAALSLGMGACNRAESPSEVNHDVAEAQKDASKDVADEQREAQADKAFLRRTAANPAREGRRRSQGRDRAMRGAGG
jgi:hypothetical protein